VRERRYYRKKKGLEWRLADTGELFVQDKRQNKIFVLRGEQITLWLCLSGRMSLSDLRRFSGVSQGKLSYHIELIEKVGLIKRS